MRDHRLLKTRTRNTRIQNSHLKPENYHGESRYLRVAAVQGYFRRRQTAPITGSDGKEMQADVIRLAPGAKLSDKVPQGSDRYLFTLRGETT
jgi:hypothetical protein